MTKPKLRAFDRIEDDQLEQFYKELGILQGILEILRPLDPAERGRVMEFAYAKYVRDVER